MPWISARMLDYYVPAGKRVFSTTPVGEAYCKTDVMVSYLSGEGDVIEDILTTATRDNLAPTWNLRFTFPKRRLQHLRVVQTANASNLENLWSIGEMRIFNGQNEMPHAPDLASRCQALPLGHRTRVRPQSGDEMALLGIDPPGDARRCGFRRAD